MLDVIRRVVDDGHFLEVHQHFARNILVGFARLGGRPVGVVANQPAHLAGTLDIDASVKARALRSLLRRLQYPARDLRGRSRLPSRHRSGVRRHHPTRRQAAVRICRGDGPEDDGHHEEGLRRRLLRDVEQAHSDRRELRVADRRDRGDGRRRAPSTSCTSARSTRRPIPRPSRTARIAEYREKFANPFIAAQRGFIDQVIRPRDTRAEAHRGAWLARNQARRNPPKKHGNIRCDSRPRSRAWASNHVSVKLVTQA